MASPTNFRKVECIIFSFFWIDRLVLRYSMLVRISGICWRDQTIRRENLISSCCLFYGREQPASPPPPVVVAPPMPAVAGKFGFRSLLKCSSAWTEFTIHGLWPDYNDGTWQACCPGRRFDIKEISTLLSIMNKYWPSYSCESASNCHGGTGIFWEHEWEKHGPCSFPVVRNEYDYFVTALKLYFKYNVTEVLRKAGFVASN